VTGERKTLFSFMHVCNFATKIKREKKAFEGKKRNEK
jgi:hypothetical protein